MTKNEAIQAAHHWQQRAEAAEKFAAGLELNLVAVIQRAEAAEGYLAELSPRYADIVAERAELETQNEKWRERAEAAEAKAFGGWTPPRCAPPETRPNEIRDLEF